MRNALDRSYRDRLLIILKAKLGALTNPMKTLIYVIT